MNLTPTQLNYATNPYFFEIVFFFLQCVSDKKIVALLSRLIALLHLT